MKPISILEYIRLGSKLIYLWSAQEGEVVHLKDTILDNMNQFINSVEKSELKVTKNALNGLKEFKERLEKTPADHLLNKEEKDTLFNIMDKILFVVTAESKTKFAFLLSEKRIDVNKLFYDITSLFAENVFDFLPESSKIDFAECGSCIALDCTTASAFHVLRGLEGLLRFLLNKLDPNIHTSKMVWGDLIRELRNLNISDLGVLIDNLDRIRANYRNPTNHPEKIYNIEEAQDLFNLCVGVVNDIVTYMKVNNYI